MKKLLAIVLALVMVLGIAVTAGAVSWVNPGTSASASPFKIEVIKLGVNADITGAKYYTVLTDAAVFSQSNLYYAVKLTLPSVNDLNNYYGNSKFRIGDQVKVTMTYTNVVNKSTESMWVTLGGSSKVLWLNQSGVFDETWTTTLSCNAGCGNNHILSAVASDTTKASIKACIGATGNLKDIKIDGCYSVVEKSYYGIKPCQKCSYTNLSGFLFQGDCANYDVFISTASNGKVTGLYVADKYDTPVAYAGAMRRFDGELYGWQKAIWKWQSCGHMGCNDPFYDGYTLAQIPYNATVSNTLDKWIDSKVKATDTDWTRFVQFQKVATYNKPCDIPETKFIDADADALYYKDKYGQFIKVDANCPEDWYVPATPGGSDGYIYAESMHRGLTGETPMNVPEGSTDQKRLDQYYKYTTNIRLDDAFRYQKQGTGTDTQLYKMLSATVVECDTSERSYLNAISHILALLGFTYADVAAGNIYMTKDNILANFGFATGAICSTAEWGAYTASITVAPIAEVPATGSMTYMGFAMIALAIAAAVVTRKVRA